jgi:hypothetical protein
MVHPVVRSITVREEQIMKNRTRLLSVAAICVPAAMAQQADAPLVTRAPALNDPALATYLGERAAANITHSDRAMIASADQTRRKLELSLKDYVVAFDPQLPNQRLRVGLPLVSFASRQWDVAYDVADKSLMAQWRFAQTTVSGQKWDYQAYLGTSGAVSLVIKAHF